jgi:hypothetical protein
MAGPCEHINDPSDSLTREGRGGGVSGLADELLVAKIGLSFIWLRIVLL